MSPSLQSGIRFAAILGVEWSTLTLLDHAPVWVKLATLVLAIAVLGILEFRIWFDARRKWLFSTSLGVLIAAYIAICAFAAFQITISPDLFISGLAWPLAAFGALGIAFTVYRSIKQHAALDKATDTPAKIDGQTQLDLIHLLDFAVNQSTVAFLYELHQTAPGFGDPLKPEKDFLRQDEEGRQYLRHANSSLGDTFRGMDFRGLLQKAQTDAEIMIKGLRLDERPQDIDPLDFREHAIVALQCTRARAFFWQQKCEVEAKIQHQRLSLIERLRLRNPS